MQLIIYFKETIKVYVEVKSDEIEFVTDRLIIRTTEEGNVHDIFILMSDHEMTLSMVFRPDDFRRNVLVESSQAYKRRDTESD